MYTPKDKEKKKFLATLFIMAKIKINIQKLETILIHILWYMDIME